MKKQELGRIGEQLACKALKKKGYRIISNNYRCRYGEIDIIARQKDFLVFVEVRSKTDGSFGCPEESINAIKKQRLIATAMDYLSKHNGISNWRIDFVAIEFDPRLQAATRVEIIENAIA